MDFTSNLERCRLAHLAVVQVGTADQTRRIAQELVVNEGVGMLMGFGLTPLAMSVAPVLNQAKIPAIITSATTSAIMPGGGMGSS